VIFLFSPNFHLTINYISIILSIITSNEEQKSRPGGRGQFPPNFDEKVGEFNNKEF